jgi:hypothetical protein
VSFFKRLALFILIMVAIILFFGLFPVVAQSATLIDGPLNNHGSKLIQLHSGGENDNIIVSIP